MGPGEGDPVTKRVHGWSPHLDLWVTQMKPETRERSSGGLASKPRVLAAEGLAEAPGWWEVTSRNDGNDLPPPFVRHLPCAGYFLYIYFI